MRLLHLFITSLTLLLSLDCSFAQERARKPLQLGATVPLSGNAATYGNLIRDGIELAVADLAERGISVAVQYEDVPVPGPAALSAIRKLTTVDGIQGLAGNFWNPAIPIMAQAISLNSVLTFHTAAADDPILDAGDFVFSTNTKVQDEAYRVAQYAFNEIALKSACVLYVGTNFGENYQRHFSQHFSALGGKVVYSDLTALDEVDLRPVLTKVKSAPCEVLFAAYFGTNLGLVLKHAGMVGLQKPVLSVYEAEDPSVVEVAGGAAEGLRFFVAEPAPDYEEAKNFSNRFLARVGYKPRILANNAYDATTILGTVLTECKGDKGCAKSKIYQIRDYRGVSGIFSIDTDGAARKPFVLKTIRNGAFVRLESGR